MLSRLHAIIAKEFLQLWRDRLALTLALFVPVAMLFIFGWAINTDVKHVPTAVLDQSGHGPLDCDVPSGRAYLHVRHRLALPAWVLGAADTAGVPGAGRNCPPVGEVSSTPG